MASKSKLLGEDLLAKIRERKAELTQSMGLTKLLMGGLDEKMSALINARDQLDRQESIISQLAGSPLNRGVATSALRVTEFLLTTSADELLTEANLLALFQKLAASQKPQTKKKTKSQPVQKHAARVKEEPKKSVRDKPAVKKAKGGFGIDFFSLRILSAAFTKDDIPETLEQALERAYGVNWQHIPIGGFLKGKITIKGKSADNPDGRTMGTDLYEEQSLLKVNYLASAYRNLLKASKHPRKAGAKLKDLLTRIVKLHDLTEVGKTLDKWGVTILVPEE